MSRYLSPVRPKLAHCLKLVTGSNIFPHYEKLNLKKSKVKVKLEKKYQKQLFGVL